MIKIEKHVTFGWEGALRGMRNPLDSWAKSDSVFCDDGGCGCCDYDCAKSDSIEWSYPDEEFCIGADDHELAAKLAAAGTEHRKYLRMIHVQMDVTAPLYWWKEMDTFKVGTVSNSCSTMHTIHKRPLTLDDFSHEHLTPFMVDKLKATVKAINLYVDEFAESGDKEHWWQVIQSLPSSYNQKRTLDLNYEVLANIYRQRKSHKLDEWRDFCAWVETLPYGELITG